MSDTPLPFPPPPSFRVRRMKERYEISEMRKQANRMTFGEVCHPPTTHHLPLNPPLPSTPLPLTVD